MYSVLQIAGIGPAWVLRDADLTMLAGQLAGGDPFRLPVAGPARGYLVLSPAVAGSITLLGPPGGTDWVPTDADLPPASGPAASVYVPQPAAPGAPLSLYHLRQAASISGLADEILVAMQNGTPVVLEVSSGTQAGTLVLSGASLPFAVVCPPAAAG